MNGLLIFFSLSLEDGNLCFDRPESEAAEDKAKTSNKHNPHAILS